MRLERILLGTFLAALACGEPEDDKCSYRINVDDDILCPGDNRIAIDDNGNGCIDRCSYVISEGVDSGVDTSSDVGVDTATEELEIVGEWSFETHDARTIYYFLSNSDFFIYDDNGNLSNHIRILSYDNDADYLIGQHDPNLSIFGNNFTRMEWINPEPNNDYIYVCFSVLTKSSLEEVENTPLADRSNPSDTGCPFDFGGSSLDSHWVYLIRH